MFSRSSLVAPTQCRQSNVCSTIYTYTVQYLYAHVCVCMSIWNDRGMICIKDWPSKRDNEENCLIDMFCERVACKSRNLSTHTRTQQTHTCAAPENCLSKSLLRVCVRVCWCVCERVCVVLCTPQCLIFTICRFKRLSPQVFCSTIHYTIYSRISALDAEIYLKSSRFAHCRAHTSHHSKAPFFVTHSPI